MQLKFLLIADAANASREGKINIAGEFNSIFGAVPIVWPSFVIVARLEANAGEGLEHAAQVRLTDEDGATIFETQPMPIRFGTSGRGIPARADIVAQVVGVAFPSYGDYTLHLLVDGVQRGDVTLYIREVPPQVAAPRTR